jgi:hypothetical protein
MQTSWAAGGGGGAGGALNQFLGVKDILGYQIKLRKATPWGCGFRNIPKIWHVLFNGP